MIILHVLTWFDQNGNLTLQENEDLTILAAKVLNKYSMR